MSRNALQVRESRWHDRWARFVRGVKRIVTVVSLICIAVLVGLLTQRATDMPVQHIAIAGDMRHIEPASLEAIIKPHVADGFLLADLRSIRQQLEGLSWVHAASVRREWPDTIKVTVTEQQPIARWGDAAYINQQGLIFEGDMMPRYAELPMLWSEHRKPSFKPYCCPMVWLFQDSPRTSWVRYRPSLRTARRCNLVTEILLNGFVDLRPCWTVRWIASQSHGLIFGTSVGQQFCDEHQILE
jgi:hypothetical protein